MTKELDMFFGIRLIVIFIIWISLGISFMHTDNYQAIFSSMVLYLVPLTLDYYGHTPLKDKNKKRRQTGLWSSIMASAIFLVGAIFSGSLDISTIILNIWTLWILWIGSGYYVYLATIDWSSYSSPEEVRYRQELQRLHREKSMNEPMENRVNHHKMKKTSTAKDEVAYSREKSKETSPIN